MSKLNTTESVLEWASAQAQRWETGNGKTDTETAEYIATAVRAYEILKRDALLYDPENEYCRLHDVLSEAEGKADKKYVLDQKIRAWAVQIAQTFFAARAAESQGDK